MKSNVKNRRFIGLLITVICAGFGITAGPEVAPLAAEIACQVVGC
ncbi:MAG: hypothetical protein AB9Q19_00500 [Candidatus Reddybacter sp.]